MSSALIAEFDALVAHQWAELATPGVWFTAAEKVAIASAGREASAGRRSIVDLPNAAHEAARRVATEPHTIRPVDLERWTDAGLRVEAYVELVGIVSRIGAIDAAAFGLGLDREPLPRPADGAPSNERPDDIEVTDGWVPTDGACYPPTALSVVPGATEALFAICAVLYMTNDEMADQEISRNGISRPQMELVAARTSYLNDCFY